MVEVWLIRHGLTDWNVAGRWQGHTDIPLNDDGRAQAHRVAAYLRVVHAKTPFDAILSSDLSRASATAATIGMALNLPVKQDERFREENYGLLEGHTAEEIKADPILSSVWAERKQRDCNGSHTDDGSESRQDSLDRTAAAFQWLDKAFPHMRVVVVTHGGFIINCFRHVHGFSAAYPVVKEHKCPKIANTSISIVMKSTSDGKRKEAWRGLQWGTRPHA
ncbi:Aste57867_10268 [Aphanomyces stellatus]|uniref:Aste57867_10268 protein n=1 Tax=Aphanomyces stellatus TaxID=120398 RepID=A0A485KPW4_9STRA|nr:hypothetical protein As57867_010228 [Aphanomyces stellatus]VFT87143.1 Aste57867_10268 [Aphanomyces stellatus]